MLEFCISNLVSTHRCQNMPYAHTKAEPPSDLHVTAAIRAPRQVQIMEIVIGPMHRYRWCHSTSGNAQLRTSVIIRTVRRWHSDNCDRSSEERSQHAQLTGVCNCSIVNTRTRCAVASGIVSSVMTVICVSLPPSEDLVEERAYPCNVIARQQARGLGRPGRTDPLR